jgi:hypothetical protein
MLMRLTFAPTDGSEAREKEVRLQLVVIYARE